MLDRNPFEDKPLKRAEVRAMRDALSDLWEDTTLVTEPNHIHVEQAGNLRRALDHLLRGDKLR